MKAKSNTAKTLKNSIFAVVAQIISFLLVFINRKVFIIFLDIEYLGYQSLFGNVFTLLSIAELGIGSAISFHLYKEIVHNNTDEIGKLMYVYKMIYRIVAIIVLTIGCGCYFLLPFIIKETSLSPGYIAIIYFLQLGSIFFGYFLSYKKILYTASQQEYKISTVNLIVSVSIQILQLGFLVIFKNYLLYLIINLSTGIIENLILSYMIDKQYPFLRNKHKITKEYLKERDFFQNSKNVVVHRLAYAVYDGTDNIVISSFLGIGYVALYGNYLTVKTGVTKLLIRQLLSPLQATIGNIVYSDRSKEDLWTQFKMFDMFSFFFATFISLGFFVFYQPFIQLWLGEKYLLPFSFVVLFCVTIYFGVVWEMVYRYRSVFGDFKQDMWFMVASAILNIAISIVGAIYLGITGVQLGTLVAFFPIAYGRIRFIVKNYFGKSMVHYFLKHFLLFLLAAAEGVACYFITRNMPVNIPYFLLRGVVWLFLPLTVGVIVFYRNEDFKEMLKYFRNIFIILFGKLKRKKKKNEGEQL